MSIDINQPNTDKLSAEQQAEVLERDKQYEAGETNVYSIDDIVAYFNIK
ncbi:MAG: hypothetical protein V4553_11445 [Bacteroidota bacterium]